MKNKTQKIWRITPSGIFVPDGTITDISDKSRDSYFEIKLKVEQLEAFYLSDKISIPENSGLAKLINNSHLFFEKWFSNRADEITMTMHFELLYLNRIAQAMLPLKNRPLRKKYLKALLSGSLDFLKRKKSEAKNIFWELELWSLLRKSANDKVQLREPPDIVLKLEKSRIGIACKKLYSERHVQNVLSEAVKQIEDSFKFGIVALNLDDLIPEDKFIRANNYTEIVFMLQKLNNQFIQKHDRHLRKYLSSGRLLCILISTTVPATTEILNFVSQKIIWNIPGLDKSKSQILKQVHTLLMDEK